MSKPKIDRVQLNQMLKKGKSQKFAAQFFGVTEAAISRAKREMKLHVTKAVALERAHEVISEHLNTTAQLQGINQKTNLILDGLMRQIKKGGPAREMGKLREIALKASQEIRGQLSLQLEIFKTLTDVTAIVEFQKEVLTVIGEANECPECGAEIFCKACGVKIDLRRLIIEKLKQARALRSGVEFKP